MLYNKYIQAYHPFERNANDFSGNGNNASNVGATATTGKFGNAYSFDGINDYMISPITSGFTTKFSLSCWVYLNAVGVNNNLITKNGDSTFTPALDKRQWILNIINTNKPRFYWFGALTAGNYKIITYDYTFSISTWYHIVLTYDNTLGVDVRSKLYINCQEIDVDAILTGGTPLNIQDSNNRIGFGNNVGDGVSTIPLSNILNGRLDNVILIDDKALTTSEIKRLYYNLHLI